MLTHLIHNESAADRVIRIFAGIVLLSLMVVGPRSAWGLIGVVPLMTGLIGYCPLYRVIGFSSCPMPDSHGRGA